MAADAGLSGCDRANFQDRSQWPNRGSADDRHDPASVANKTALMHRKLSDSFSAARGEAERDQSCLLSRCFRADCGALLVRGERASRPMHADG